MDNETNLLNQPKYNNLQDGQTAQGELTIFRKGHYMGCDKKFKVYLNNQLYGEIDNKELVKFYLPYGAYTLHFECGLTKKCKDITIEITLQEPKVYVLTSVKASFWKNHIVIEKRSESNVLEL